MAREERAHFRIIKFKTMNDKRDVNGSLLPDMDRITPAGRFIRKTSLDEIPQFYIVLAKSRLALVTPCVMPSKVVCSPGNYQLRRGKRDECWL